MIISKAGCVCSLSAFLSDHLDILDCDTFEIKNLCEILIPELLVGHNSVDKILYAIIYMLVVELENPSVIRNCIFIASTSLADKTLLGQSLDVV